MSHSRVTHSLIALLTLALCAATFLAAPIQASASEAIEFNLIKTIDPPGTGPVIGVKSAYFDNDTKADLVVATGNSIVLYAGDGEGGYTFATELATPAQVTCMDVGDYNADGSPDVVFGDNAGYLRCYFGNGDVEFEPVGKVYDLDHALGSVTSIRLDTDWKEDWVVTRPSQDDIVLCFNDGTGGVGSTDDRYQGSGSAPSDIAAAYLNGDSRTDLAILCSGYPGIRCYLSDSGGNLVSGAGDYVTLTGAPRRMTAARFDADDDVDLLVSSSSSALVHKLINNGSGKFTASTTGVTGTNVGIDCFPLDVGDRLADLALVDIQHDTFEGMMNNGSGGFSAAWSYALPTQVTGLEQIVMDWDDRLDYAVYGQDRVYVFGNVSAPWVFRLAGSNRYSTAVEISKRSYPMHTNNVVLTTGENFPDALAGAPLSRMLNGPILLTKPDSLPPIAKTELERLNPTTVYILGGTSAVSEDVEDAVSDLGATIVRIGGKDRYETAALIAKQLDNLSPTDIDTAFFATGENFPDALAAGSYASMMGQPILLVRRDSIPAATRDAIDDIGIAHSRVLGGEAVVSSSVYGALPDADRMWGVNRFATACAIAEGMLDDGGDTRNIAVATGTNFPDALAVGPTASFMNAPLLLVEQDAVPGSIANFLGNWGSRCNVLFVTGGTSAIADDTVDDFIDCW